MLGKQKGKDTGTAPSIHTQYAGSSAKRSAVQLKRANINVINLLVGPSKSNCSSISLENSNISRLMSVYYFVLLLK
jgi:hypothetical protein